MSDEPSRVSIRAPNWVGDVVMATPAFRAVRHAMPQAHVKLVVRASVEPVVRGAPWFDEVLIYQPGRGMAVGEFMRCVSQLRKPAQGLGLVLPNSFSSALMFRLAGVQRRVGYVRDMRSFLLTDAVPRPTENGRFKPTYMVETLALCQRAGLEPAGRQMELCYSEADVEQVRALLRNQGVDPAAPLFLMHPGAGFGPSKRWPNENFARLAEILQAECGAQIALVAGPAERGNVAAIIAGSRARITDLTASGIDLHLLKCAVALSRLLVTTDSGPRHYGVALGVPTVCIMGPTHPGYSTGTQPNDHVLRVEVDCGPCQLRVCPRDHRCMADITPEMAARACLDALSASKRASDT